MAAQRISASALIPAPPAALYALVADYHDGHQRIIPRPPFVSLDVEEGGTGAGTRIRVGIRIMGRTQTYRAVVSEPQPGRVLVEANDTGYVTTFTVEPREGGRAAEVTISTELPRRPAPLALLERWLMTPVLRPMFVRELELLARVAAERG